MSCQNSSHIGWRFSKYWPKKTTRAHDTSHNDDLACHVEEAGIRVGTALPPARTISAT